MISALDALTVLNSIAILFAIASGAEPAMRAGLNKRGILLFFALITSGDQMPKGVKLAHVVMCFLLMVVIADVEVTILSIMSWFLLAVHAMTRMTRLDAVAFE